MTLVSLWILLNDTLKLNLDLGFSCWHFHNTYLSILLVRCRSCSLSLTTTSDSFHRSYSYYDDHTKIFFCITCFLFLYYLLVNKISLYLSETLFPLLRILFYCMLFLLAFSYLYQIGSLWLNIYILSFLTSLFSGSCIWSTLNYLLSNSTSDPFYTFLSRHRQRYIDDSLTFGRVIGEIFCLPCCVCSCILSSYIRGRWTHQCLLQRSGEAYTYL